MQLGKHWMKSPVFFVKICLNFYGWEDLTDETGIVALHVHHRPKAPISVVKAAWQTEVCRFQTPSVLPYGSQPTKQHT